MITDFNSRILRFMELLSITIIFFKRKFIEIMYLAAIPFLCYSVISLFLPNGTLDEILKSISISKEITYVIYALYFTILYIVSPILMYLITCFLKNDKFSIKEAIKYSREKWLKILTGMIIYLLIMSFIIILGIFVLNLLGNIAFISNIIVILIFVLFFKLYIDLLFWSQSTIIKNLYGIKAIKYSINLARKYWSKIFLDYLLLILFCFFISNILGMIIIPFSGNLLISNILLSFFQSIIMLFILSFTTIYFINIDSYNNNNNNKELD